MMKSQIDLIEENKELKKLLAEMQAETANQQALAEKALYDLVQAENKLIIQGMDEARENLRLINESVSDAKNNATETVETILDSINSSSLDEFTANWLKDKTTPMLEPFKKQRQLLLDLLVKANFPRVNHYDVKHLGKDILTIDELFSCCESYFQMHCSALSNKFNIRREYDNVDPNKYIFHEKKLTAALFPALAIEMHEHYKDNEGECCELLLRAASTNNPNLCTTHISLIYPQENVWPESLSGEYEDYYQSMKVTKFKWLKLPEQLKLIIAASAKVSLELFVENKDGKTILSMGRAVVASDEKEKLEYHTLNREKYPAARINYVSNNSNRYENLLETYDGLITLIPPRDWRVGLISETVLIVIDGNISEHEIIRITNEATSPLFRRIKVIVENCDKKIPVPSDKVLVLDKCVNKEIIEEFAPVCNELIRV